MKKSINIRSKNGNYIKNMNRAFNKIIEEKIDEINSEFDFAELNEKLENYEINIDNLNVGDLKTIYNNLALELDEEPIYSNEEIAKDILSEVEKSKEKEEEKEY